MSTSNYRVVISPRTYKDICDAWLRNATNSKEREAAMCHAYNDIDELYKEIDHNPRIKYKTKRGAEKRLSKIPKDIRDDFFVVEVLTWDHLISVV